MVRKTNKQMGKFFFLHRSPPYVALHGLWYWSLFGYLTESSGGVLVLWALVVQTPKPSFIPFRFCTMATFKPRSGVQYVPPSCACGKDEQGSIEPLWERKVGGASIGYGNITRRFWVHSHIHWLPTDFLEQKARWDLELCGKIVPMGSEEFYDATWPLQERRQVNSSSSANFAVLSPLATDQRCQHVSTDLSSNLLLVLGLRQRLLVYIARKRWALMPTFDRSAPSEQSLPRNPAMLLSVTNDPHPRGSASRPFWSRYFGNFYSFEISQFEVLESGVFSC